MICVAPGLFSTTTGWPQISESRAPIERDSASVAPPGVVGTTIFTGREGNCASAADASKNRKTGTDHVFQPLQMVTVTIYRISSSTLRSSGLGIETFSAVAAR